MDIIIVCAHWLRQCEHFSPRGCLPLKFNFYRLCLVHFSWCVRCNRCDHALSAQARAALSFFLLALAVNGTYALWTLLMNPALRALRGEMYFGMVMGFVVLCLISAYVYRLRERGLL